MKTFVDLGFCRIVREPNGLISVPKGKEQPDAYCMIWIHFKKTDSFGNFYWDFKHTDDEDWQRLLWEMYYANKDKVQEFKS